MPKKITAYKCANGAIYESEVEAQEMDDLKHFETECQNHPLNLHEGEAYPTKVFIWIKSLPNFHFTYIGERTSEPH